MITEQEQGQEEERVAPADGLIALYAERLQRRNQMLARPHQSKPAPELHQFGRGPRPVSQARRRVLQQGATVSALVAAALVVGSQAASAATTYRVVQGDTLSGIADHFQVSQDKIAQLNGLQNPDLIVEGTVLAIDGVPPPSAPAAGGTTAPASSPFKVHHVLQGESLSLIAGKYGVTLRALMDENNIQNPDLIEVGIDLRIPTAGSNSTDPARVPGDSGNLALHLVAPGETLAEIAAKYGVTYQALASANSLTDPDHIEAGQLLQVPGAGAVQQGSTVKLRGMPVMQQSLPLSCEPAAVSMATAYWGNQISEWVLIENLPSASNPHDGFRGSMSGAFGGTADYGVYAEPFVPLLDHYGFTGDVFYAGGDSSLLTAQIDQGHPVVAWVTNMTSAQPKSYAYDQQGSRFALVPQEHAVVVYGYDDERVFVADPGDGAFRQFSWDDFMRSWGYFDGMSLAVYPRA